MEVKLVDRTLDENYEFCRNHFIERLMERYGISITTDEYDDLVKTHHSRNTLYKLNSVSSVIFLPIKGKIVYCIYARKSLNGKRRLKTCLKEEYHFPAPKVLGVNGMNSTMFEQEVNDFIKLVHDKSEIFRRIGQKEFYMSHIPMNNKIKKAVKDYCLLGTFSVGLAVQYIIDKYNLDGNNEDNED